MYLITYMKAATNPHNVHNYSPTEFPPVRVAEVKSHTCHASQPNCYKFKIKKQVLDASLQTSFALHVY